MPSFSVILYTNAKVDPIIFNAALFSVRQQINPDQLIVVTHTYIDHPLLKGCRQIIYKPTGHHVVDIYSQIMTGINLAKGEICFSMEHDVLYPHTYYQECLDNLQSGRVNYANQIWFLNSLGYWTYSPSTFLSTSFGEKLQMIDAVYRKIHAVDHLLTTASSTFDMARGEGESHYEFANVNPVLDIRHRTNLTPTGTMRKQQNIHDTIPYWGKASYMIEQLKLDFDHDIKHNPSPPKD